MTAVVGLWDSFSAEQASKCSFSKGYDGLMLHDKGHHLCRNGNLQEKVMQSCWGMKMHLDTSFSVIIIIIKIE